MKHYSTYQSQFIEMFEGDKYPKTRLGDFVSIRTGKLDANASSENGKYPFFTCGVETLKIDDYAFDCEAVLLAGNGEFCVKYYNGKFNAYQRTYVIETLDNNVISVPYLYAWFGQYAKVLRGKAIGGIIKYIKMGDLTEAKISFPPLEVQNSYVAIAQQADKSKFTSLKSQFIEMFWGGKYTMKKLRVHIEVLRGVSYKPSDVHEDLSDNTSIVLRSNNIDGGQVNFDDLVYVDSERVSEHQVLNAGDIVMCGSNGSKKLVGKAALLNETPRENTSFGAFCLGIRCKSSIIPEYLATYFQTSFYRDKIEALGSGSNILNIKPDHIYDLEIPIPSLGEQETFVSIVKQADKSKYIN